MASSLHELANTNRILTVEEEKDISGLYSVYKVRMAELRKRKDEMERQLNSLKKERDTLIESGVPLKQALSPFRRLPRDIICEIFTACIYADDYPTMSGTEAPTLLTQICSDMRYIALDTPALWAAVHIPIISSIQSDKDKDKARSLTQKQVIGIREWLLKRSGNMVLRISVWENAGKYAMLQLKTHMDILDIVMSCCNRWSDIHLWMNFPELLPRLAALTPADVPNLRSFYMDLNIFHETILTTSSWAQLGFLARYQLKRLGTLPWNTAAASTLPLNWRTLTHLSITEINDAHTNQLAQILNKCACLVSLSMAVPEISTSTSIVDIHLPSLQILRINETRALYQAESLFGIFSAIIAPALHIISYKAIPVGTKRHVDSAWLLVLVSQAFHITELSLEYLPTPDLLEQCLRSVPHLNILIIYSYEPPSTPPQDKYSEIIAQLSHDPPALSLCPELEYFRCNTQVAMSAEQFRTLVLRRTSGVQHLAKWKKLEMAIFCTIGEEFLYNDIVEKEAVKGVDIKLSFTNSPIHKPLGFHRGRRLPTEAWPTTIWPLEASERLWKFNKPR